MMMSYILSKPVSTVALGPGRTFKINMVPRTPNQNGGVDNKVGQEKIDMRAAKLRVYGRHDRAYKSALVNSSISM